MAVLYFSELGWDPPRSQIVANTLGVGSPPRTTLIVNAGRLGAPRKRLRSFTVSSTAVVAKHLCVGRTWLEMLLEAGADVFCTSEVAVRSYEEAPDHVDRRGSQGKVASGHSDGITPCVGAVLSMPGIQGCFARAPVATADSHISTTVGPTLPTCEAETSPQSWRFAR